MNHRQIQGHFSQILSQPNKKETEEPKGEVRIVESKKEENTSRIPTLCGGGHCLLSMLLKSSTDFFLAITKVIKRWNDDEIIYFVVLRYLSSSATTINDAKNYPRTDKYFS